MRHISLPKTTSYCLVIASIIEPIERLKQHKNEPWVTIHIVWLDMFRTRSGSNLRVFPGTRGSYVIKDGLVARRSVPRDFFGPKGPPNRFFGAKLPRCHTLLAKPKVFGCTDATHIRA
jgi:hypothetical protein